MARFDVYVITESGRLPGRGHLEIARAAIAGGAHAIQFRDKTAAGPDLLPLATALAERCRAAGVLFIVNDRLDLALAAGADGVHLGQEDLFAPGTAREARACLGPECILGVSAATPEEARRAWDDGADYVGVGAIFPTDTKADAGPAIGPAALTAIRAAVGIPVVAVGGITAANAPAVIAAGADGVAVISAVTAAPDMAAATRALALAVRRAKAARH